MQTHADPQPTDLITTGEAARMLGVATRAIRAWITQGLLPAVRLPGGGHNRIRRGDVEALIARGTR